jgi:drug/metabolite transporter (DMT)-like permease
MQSPQSKWPGLAMALASAILFSTLAIFVKLAYRQQLTVNAVVVLRMVFASIFLWLTVLLSRRERQNWKIAAADWPALLGGVVLTYGISEFTYFTGLQLLPAGVAIFLIYVYPVLVVFIAYFLYGEPPTRRKIGVAAVCLLGCAILSFRPDGGFSFSGWGIALILISALCIALYSAFSQKLLKNYSPAVISAWTVTPVGAVFLLMDSPNLSGYLNFPAAAWLIMLGAAFFATFVSLILFFRAVVRIGAAHTALLSTIEPVSTALMANWILGEQMSRWQMLGAALILGGLIVLEWPAKENLNFKRKAGSFATSISKEET